MRYIKQFVLIFVLTLFGSQALAQDIWSLETPYEKARGELAMDAVTQVMQSDIGLALGIGLAMAEMYNEDCSEWKRLEYYEEVISKIWGAYNWLDPETYHDFLVFERVGPACENYARKRAALEKRKTKLDIERERQRNTSAGALSTVMMEVRSAFLKQMKKGDYEKLVQYKQRIAETGPYIFDSIAQSICRIHALNSKSLYKRIYDVEREIDSMYLGHNEDNIVVATSHITPEMAKRVYSKDVDIKEDVINICEVNGYLFPYRIALSTDEELWQYVTHPINKNVAVDTNVVFSVSEIGITDTNILQVIGNHMFNFNRIIASARSLPYVLDGDEKMASKDYFAAKRSYENAIQINPEDKTIKEKLVKAENAIAEQERMARIEEKRRLVRKNVNIQIKSADDQIKEGKLKQAIITLEEAINITQTNDYNYRQSEMESRIDSIKQIQKIVADPSITHEYKSFAPDLYNNTNLKITSNLRTFILEKDKRLERSNMSFTFYTSQNRESSFTLLEPSRALKNFCKEQLNTVCLQPIVIDDKILNASATFDYSFEFAKGTVMVKQRAGMTSVTPKYDMSPQLKSDLQSKMTNNIKSLPSSCNGNYKFAVTSIDINGQMEHSVELKSCSFDNGPQNAWRSLIVPGWGDEYVDGEFAVKKMLLSYGLMAIGVPCLFAKDRINVNYVGCHFDYEIERYVDEYDTTYSNPTRVLGIIATSCGAAIWVADVVHVFIKGRNNKRENKERLGRLSFAYDPKHDVPQLLYTLRF